MKSQRGFVIIVSFLPILISVTLGGLYTMGLFVNFRQKQWLCRTNALQFAWTYQQGKHEEAIRALDQEILWDTSDPQNITGSWLTEKIGDFHMKGQCAYNLIERKLL